MIVEWSPEALERVTELAEWIALNNEEAAVQWIDDIFAHVEKLSHSPRSGRMVPEEMRDELRGVIWRSTRHATVRCPKGDNSTLAFSFGRRLKAHLTAPSKHVSRASNSPTKHSSRTHPSSLDPLRATVRMLVEFGLLSWRSHEQV